MWSHSISFLSSMHRLIHGHNCYAILFIQTFAFNCSSFRISILFNLLILFVCVHIVVNHQSLRNKTCQIIMKSKIAGNHIIWYHGNYILETFAYRFMHFKRYDIYENINIPLYFVWIILNLFIKIDKKSLLNELWKLFKSWCTFFMSGQ